MFGPTRSSSSNKMDSADAGRGQLHRRDPRRHGLTIVTGNERDFRRPGLKVFNPFKELPHGFDEEA